MYIGWEICCCFSISNKENDGGKGAGTGRSKGKESDRDKGKETDRSKGKPAKGKGKGKNDKKSKQDKKGKDKKKEDLTGYKKIITKGGSLSLIAKEGNSWANFHYQEVARPIESNVTWYMIVGLNKITILLIQGMMFRKDIKKR